MDSCQTLNPKFLCLGFHDCVGGCDGCIGLNNIDNNGLEGPMDEILPLVEKFKGSYSWADIWTIAALISTNLAIMEDRPDCPSQCHSLVARTARMQTPRAMGGRCQDASQYLHNTWVTLLLQGKLILPPTKLLP